MGAKKVNINISEERHCNEFESLGSIFRPIIKDALSSDDLVEVDIMLNWVDIVGENISAYSRPVKAVYDNKTDKRTLNIDVPVGGFALEIQHKEQYILDKIKLGELKKVLFVGTGALLSPTSSLQKESIPGIAHAVLITNEWEVFMEQGTKVLNNLSNVAKTYVRIRERILTILLFFKRLNTINSRNFNKGFSE